MNNKSKYNVVTYFFLLLTVFVLFLFTKNIYYTVKENSNVKASLEEKITQKQEEYDKLSKIKLAIESGKSDVKDINKFLINFNEDQLTKYFYDYTNSTAGRATIESISLQEGKLNEFGFKEGKIDLTVSFISEYEMINMLNFLLNSDKYNFYIHDFKYEFGGTSGTYKINIPLKVLYK